MKSKFTWIFTLIMAFFIQFAFAQQKTVSGVVTDAQGMPIPGVTVSIKGQTAGGVQTDFDGKYAIQASQSQKIVFSFVGMATQEVTVGASNTVSVQLADDSKLLDEVIVVGYGTATKEGYTGTATKIEAKNLEAKAATNISQALRGEVAGVNVITGSGAPGSDATIRIRGFGSVNGNQAPLYVVDGAPYSSDISALNQADVESITVLKDAAATSIYGSRGANGVILITTKQGKAGKSVISVDFRTSINTQMLPTYNTITSPEEYIGIEWSQLKTQAALNGNPNPAGYASANLYGGNVGINNGYNIWDVPGDQLIDPATGQVRAGVNRRFTPTTWKDAAFGTGIRKEANLQMSGGNETTKYSTSFGYLDDEGYVVNSGYKRYTTRINLEHKPKDWLTVGGNIAYTGGRYKNSSSDEGDSGSSGNIFALTNNTPTIYDVYLRDTNGNLVADPIFGGNRYDYGNSPYVRRVWNSTNGIGDAHYDLNQNDATTLLGNFNFNINFTKWLTFEARYNGQYQSFDNSSRQNQWYGSGFSSEGFLSKSTQKINNQNFLQLLRFKKEFGEHSVEAFVAHESTDWKYQVSSAAAQKAILPNTLDLYQYTTPFGRAQSYTRRWTLESYFAQLNYNYAQKYYLTASVRRDGSSTFLKDRWGTFGSVGLGWILSKENFLANAKFVNFLKLKASYGVIGDRGITETNQQTQGGVWIMNGYQNFLINQTDSGEYSFSAGAELANPDLTWETSYVSQVGLESTFFNNSLDVNVDYYVKDTKDLFFNQQLALYPGYSIQRYNSGKLRNSGLEFDVQGHIIKASNPADLSLSIGVNGEIFKNKLVEVPVHPEYGSKDIQVEGSYGWAKGHSIYDYYLREWAGVNPSNGAAMWNLYYDDINGNGVFDSADVRINNMNVYTNANPNAKVGRTTTENYSDATLKFTGKSAIPKIRGSFRLNAGYKNFDFTAQFGYSIGGYVMDNGYAELMSTGSLIGSTNFHTDIRERWQQPGDITNVPRLANNATSADGTFGSASNRFLTKADYLSLNNVRLGYTIPERFTEKLHVSLINLYLSGDNLMMISARKGLNPQTMIASSNSGIYMPMTIFSFGAKVQF
ncbi:SusC/RagA family TonB-linked outer membrane protein [Flavobacterium sp. Sd200]|uniref:SusC/RagA family TonB-linked outer membrane protein n=1 Tax=Flavobacterium sp. Sd200 TaxID=2692211 RepID=UPI00136EB8C9|nr:SusC/RagA family TonB-linked outer membrane protein [Flavobacterium sp. Sd200]MXN91899.1 SusC/RagA family TonB-linked outer membrane protein [Flavobacterium sp. Sd200]